MSKPTNPNIFLKFIKGLKPIEWGIFIVTIVFVGVMIWGFTRPKVTPESKPVDPEVKVRIYEFWGQGCPHCAAADPFLKGLDSDSKEVELHQYEVYYNTDNQQKNKKVAEALGVEYGGVPFIVIGDKVFNGFDSAEGSGVEIKARVDFCTKNICEDKTGEVLGFPKLVAKAE